MIILARESRGWSQAELAEKVKISPASLSKIERNEIGIQQNLLTAIAEATCYPLQFFLQPGEILPLHLLYRRRHQVPQKLITPVEARINIIQRHVQMLTRVLNKPLPSIPLFKVDEKNTAIRIAGQVRKAWEITEPVINDLSKIIESHHIAIGCFDFGTERIDSRSMLTQDKYPIIFINTTLTGDRQRFSLAYELGHLFMHTFTIVPPDNDISHEANQFAAELLMPAREIKKDFEQGITIPVLAELKRKWKVSMIALLYRADDLGLLTPNQKRYLLQQFNQMKIRRREPPELDVTPEKPKLIRCWLAEYQQKTRLGIQDIAAILSLHVDEYLKLYN